MFLSFFWHWKLIVLACFLALSGCSEPPTPEEAKVGAKRALDFCKVTFAEKNMSAGYKMLASNTRKDISPQIFEEIMKQLHPDGYPSQFKALEYQKIPEKNMMDIFLIGNHGDKKFHYRVTLKGTAEKGFWVNEVYRSADSIVSFGDRHKIVPPIESQ